MALEIRVAQYRLVNEIGQGSFSTVYFAYDDKNSIYAIKRIQLDKIKKSVISKFLLELNISSSLNHNNIIKCHETLKTENNWYIVTEYCDGGTLIDYLKDRKILQTIDYEKREQDIKQIMVQLKDGLKYLTGKKIYHRDLKPQNILFKNEGGNIVLKIADFGFARYFSNDSLTADGYYNMATTFCGSPLYMAPELILENKYNIKADLWACGVILYEMMYEKNPFEKPTSIPQLSKRMKDGTISFPAQYSVNCINLVKSLLTINPRQRIEWIDFFNHPWISDRPSDRMSDKISDRILENIDLDLTQYQSMLADDDYINDYVMLDDAEMKKIKSFHSDVQINASSIYQLVINSIGYLIS